MRRMTWLVAASLGGVLVIVLAAGTALAADASVAIAGFAFTPGDVTITAGETVTWSNRDATAHTATGGGFDTERLDPGQTASITFHDAGTFRYACAIHPQMTGTVVVRAAAATPASTDTVAMASVEGSDPIGAVGVLLAVFGASMLVATFWTSRRARSPSRRRGSSS